MLDGKPTRAIRTATWSVGSRSTRPRSGSPR